MEYAVKYCFRCTNFRENLLGSAVLYRNIFTQISPKLINKYAKYRYKCFASFNVMSRETIFTKLALSLQLRKRPNCVTVRPTF
jgi:hypothetical protein